MSVDLLVVGGGVNGAGIARDAAGRGLSVLLVEKDDLASATSSWSSKLIHGGLRYLEQYEFRLVAEALAEREILLSIARHLVWPARFVMPHVPELRPRWMIRAGLFLYDNLGRFGAALESRRAVPDPAEEAQEALAPERVERVGAEDPGEASERVDEEPGIVRKIVALHPAVQPVRRGPEDGLQALRLDLWIRRGDTPHGDPGGSEGARHLPVLPSVGRHERNQLYRPRSSISRIFASTASPSGNASR